METDGGGWTIFQRRTDGSVNFTRNWTEYRNGFGNISSEFWIGNVNLFKILRYGRYEMRMDMGDFEGESRYIKYSHISLGDEDTMFTIHLSGYSGNIRDCFTQNKGINGMQFSTFDQDNDLLSSRSCAINYPAGWWFNSCHCANPNGLYLKGETDIWGKGITYAYWRENYYSLKYTRMMVRRVL
ncbi:ficolin-2-like [Saccostrea echinata]|uniref:ficolin-2-like n=1 Tax=Saccostrea echinata TaxID=191078 RepID=UPI002A83637E|nr:ficolin-2-like [Saccostrea echinata]